MRAGRISTPDFFFAFVANRIVTRGKILERHQPAKNYLLDFFSTRNHVARLRENHNGGKSHQELNSFLAILNGCEVECVRRYENRAFLQYVALPEFFAANNRIIPTMIIHFIGTLQDQSEEEEAILGIESLPGCESKANEEFRNPKACLCR